MRNLLTALDWSAQDGSVVRQALDQLGPEAYDASARTSLAQQTEFNVLLRRMLGNMQTERAASPGGSNRPDAPGADSWQAWATPYGAGSWQGSHGSASGWQSTGIEHFTFEKGADAKRQAVWFETQSVYAEKTLTGTAVNQGTGKPDAFPSPLRFIRERNMPLTICLLSCGIPSPKPEEKKKRRPHGRLRNPPRTNLSTYIITYCFYYTTKLSCILYLL